MENSKIEIAKISLDEANMCFENTVTGAEFKIDLKNPSDKQFIDAFSDVLSTIQNYDKKGGEVFEMTYPTAWINAEENALSLQEEIVKEFCDKINSELQQISSKISEIDDLTMTDHIDH